MGDAILSAIFRSRIHAFFGSLFHSAARRHGRRCARAGRGKPDIDVVVQLEWVNPKTKHHLILQNSSVVSKKTSKNAQDADATTGEGGRVEPSGETAPK